MKILQFCTTNTALHLDSFLRVESWPISNKVLSGCVINVMQWEGRRELRKLCIFNFYCHNSKSLLFYYYHMDGSKKKGIYSSPLPTNLLGHERLAAKRICAVETIYVLENFSACFVSGYFFLLINAIWCSTILIVILESTDIYLLASLIW